MIKPSSLLYFAVLLIICITVSYAIVYAHIQHFSLSELENTDASVYLAMYRNEIVHGNGCYRILTPFLARVLPDPPRALFDENRDIDDFWIAKVKFGMVNFFFLVATGVLFFYFLNGLGLSISESLLGVLFFYTARPVMQNIGTPLVDASLNFFLPLCLYALYRQSLVLLFMGFSIGVLAKETIFLIFPMILLLPRPSLEGRPSQFKHKTQALVSIIPATLAYLVFRFNIYPDPTESYFNLRYISSFKYQLLSLTRFNKILDLFSSFGLLWLPAIYALTLAESPLLLKRWSWSILVILGGIFLFRGNLGSMLFMAFPVVIPLALFGLRSMLRLPSDT